MAADDAPTGAKQFRALRIMTILALLAGAGCTQGHGEHLAREELDCQHRDKDICLMADAIWDQLLELASGRGQIGRAEQVEQDVSAILNGMRRNGADADARVRNVVTDPIASAVGATLGGDKVGFAARVQCRCEERSDEAISFRGALDRSCAHTIGIASSLRSSR